MDQGQAPQHNQIIGEEVLTGLPMFRHLICTMYMEWAEDEDPTVKSFILAVAEIFREPIVNFDKAYKLFNDQCGQGPLANFVSDHWRVFQMMVYTEMDESREKIFNDFTSMVRRIMGDSPGGAELFLRNLQNGNVAAPNGPASITIKMDYLILLAIRVYLGGIRGVAGHQSTSPANG